MVLLICIFAHTNQHTNLMYVFVFKLDTVCFSKSHYSIQEGGRVQIDLIVNKRLSKSISVKLSYDNSLTASSK